jgi:hypothetical protein
MVVLALSLSAALLVAPIAIAADAMPNACPVDGCEVKIVSVKQSGDELELTFEANFTPDVSKNHLHVWWGEKYTVKQAGRGAKPVFGVEKGAWHRHDDYPTYVTQGAASTGVRDGAVSLCVSSADRDHNILDVETYHCVDISDHL